MKNLAKTSLIIIVIITTVIVSAFGLVYSTVSSNENTIKSYTWRYAGQNLNLRLGFKKSLNEAYLNLKRQPLGADSAVYYKQFLTVLAQDNLIKDLAAGFQVLSKQTGLSEVLLVTSFTQDLPYNHQTSSIGFYYNTLLNGRGTCWEKSILNYLLLKELGYGVGIVYFRAVPLPNGGCDHHVASAITDDSPYGLLNGCAYIETHNITPIGWLPKVSGPGSLAMDPQAVYPEHNRKNLSKLGPYRMLFKVSGKKLPSALAIGH